MKLRPFHRMIRTLAVLGILAGTSAGFARADDSTLNRSVSGGGTAAPSSTKPNGIALPSEVACGMVCRYNRANDNLTLQAVYLLKKITLVDTAIKDNPESPAARTALGGFCQSSAESLDDCFKRYKDFQRVGLLQIRQAIGKNEDTVARLTSGRREDGSVDQNGLTFDIGEDKPGYLPEVATLSDLENAYKQGKLGKPTGKYSADDVRKWSQELVLSNPRGTTIEFKKDSVEGNPYQTEKTSYRLYMTNKDGNGNDKADPKAAALIQKSQQRIQDYSTDKDINVTGVRPITPAQTKEEDSISYEAFKESRSLLNSRIEGDLNQDAQKTAERKLASDAKKNASGGASKSGSADAAKDGPLSRDIKVNAAARAPATSVKSYDVEERVKLPESLKNSRYIKYNLNDLYKDIEETTDSDK